LGSLLGALVLSLTVILVVGIGIAAAYGTVMVILQGFAPHSQERSSAKPAFVAKARAAHAGGD